MPKSSPFSVPDITAISVQSPPFEPDTVKLKQSGCLLGAGKVSVSGKKKLDLQQPVCLSERPSGETVEGV